MPAKKRVKTKYPGVYYTLGVSVSSGKSERIYYIRYRKDGRAVEEKAGRQFQDDMTPARAAMVRAQRIDGNQLSNQEKRDAEKAAQEAESGRWTIGKLAISYFQGRPDNKARSVDKGRYEKYLKAPFGKKEPREILPFDVDRLRVKLLKQKSPQTVKHILNLFTWVINYGVKNNLCEGIPFHIKKPTVNNQRTEDLMPDELARLLKAIDADSNIQVANLMRLALVTGMRRGELFKLEWGHINFDRGFITLQDPKGGPDQRIPLGDAAKDILNNHPRTESKYVFPGQKGKQRQTAHHTVNRIKKRAGLPKNFRPLHGLRHAFASGLANSGQVDMYQLQRLLTHKDPRMTQRYAHLRDDALKRAANVAGDIVTQAEKLDDKTKVIGMDDHKK